MASHFDLTVAPETRPWSISQLTARLRRTLESNFPSVWVEGEISNFKNPSSGHWYFTLVEQDRGQIRAQLHASCFYSTNRRLNFRPTNGQLVRARGTISIYPPHGQYQLQVEQLEAVGDGRLLVAYEELKKRLEAEGLFDSAIKRPLPRFPKRVGIVTSSSGAAIRDILNILSRRTRTVHALVSPTRVQGIGAANEIAQAIRLLNEHHRRAITDGRLGKAIDVIIVARGGGSLEDLWAFNEEVVARSIRASVIPVISGIGHETDVTIADFAADKRAPTPSAAAELVAEQEHELAKQIAKHTAGLLQAMRYRLMTANSQLEQTGIAGALQEVRSHLRQLAMTTDGTAQTLQLGIERIISGLKHETRDLQQKLVHASPWSRLSSAKHRENALKARLDKALQKRMREASQELQVVSDRLVGRRPEALLADLRLKLQGLASEVEAAIRARLPSERQFQNVLDTRLDRAVRSQLRSASSNFQDINDRLARRRPEIRVAAARIRIHNLETLAQAAIRSRMRAAQATSDQLDRRFSVRRPTNRISDLQLTVNRFSASLSTAMQAHLFSTSNRVQLASASLEALSPLSVLERGYAIAQDRKGVILRDAESVRPNDEVSVRLAKGKLITRVDKAQPE